MSPLLKKRNGGDEKSLLRKYCLVAGLLAFLVMMFTYLCHDNTLTLGENTVLRMDLYHQYGPLYAELYDRIVNGYSLVYSWTSGLGGAFLGNLFNYCCSPFALIILLVGHQNMPEAIAVMILLNAVASAMTFTYYVNKTTETVNKMSIGLGLLYAFCGYFVAYSWNIMWLDAMSVFPLVILGIERIIQKNRPSLYIFAMTYTMITNYYMAYMVCILSVLWFLYYYFSRYELLSPLTRAAENVPAAAAEEAVFEVITPVPATAPETVAPDAAVPDAAVSEEAAREAVEAAVSREAAAIDAVLNAAVPEGDALSEDIVVTTGVQTVADDAAARATAVTEPVPAVSGEAPEASSAAPAEKAEAAVPVQPEPSVQPAPEAGFAYAPPAEPAGNAGKTAKAPKAARRKKDKTGKRRLTASRFWVSGWSFALSSLLCFLISAFALLPVYYCLQTSSATGGTFPSTMKIYFNLFDFVANHLPALTTTIRSSGDVVLPNIYCGLLSVMLLPLFFFSKHVTGRKKIATAVLIGVFYFSFSLNYLNYIWHGMHMPNDLPFRYSFAYSFLLLLIACQVFLHIDEFSNRVYVGVGVGVIGFIILVDELGSQNVSTKTVNIVLIFAVVYVVLLGLLRSRKFERGAVVSLLIIAIITELCVSDVSNFVMQQPKANYVTDYPVYQEIREAAEGEDDDLFYRTEISKLRARMDPCWYGYNGVSTFSSMAYEHAAKLMEDLGMFGNDINSYTYYPQTPIFNSMFALKYIYDNNDLVSENDYYKEVASNDTFTAYAYQYPLPIAFAVSENVTGWEIDGDDPFATQNDFIRQATGVADVLTPAEVTELSFDNVREDLSVDTVNSLRTFSVYKSNTSLDGTLTAYIDVPEEGQYYVYTGSTRISSIDITAENYHYSYSSSSVQPFTLDLGLQPEGARIRVEYSLTDDDDAVVDLYAVKIDGKKFEEAYRKIRNNGLLELDSFEETKLSGKITVKGEDKLLYTSIPYDESWAVYVDGEYISYGSGDIVKVGDALLGVRIPAGEHTVSLRYYARGLDLGLKMTALGLMILAFLLFWKYFLSERVGDRIRLKLVRHPDWEIR